MSYSPSKGGVANSTAGSSAMPRLNITTTSSAADKTAQPGVVGLMRELDRLQGEQVSLARKIELEKRRKDKLDVSLDEARTTLRAYQDATKGGSIVKDEDTLSKKLTAKLEHQLQQARIKLSATHKDNAAMKRRIDETRQDKIMHLSILHNVERDYHDARVKIKRQQAEIIEINEHKHRLDVEIANLRQRMFQEMELFSSELVTAKQNISHTQTNILDLIRERLQNTFNNLDLSEYDVVEKAPPPKAENPDNSAEERRVAVEEVLTNLGVGSLEELIVTLQVNEEAIFSRYNEIQEKTRVVEQMDLDNRHMETEVENRMRELQTLEESNLLKQQDLEVLIAGIKKSIYKHEADYGTNEELLGLIKAPLLKLFKNIAIDEDALDQQIISTGVNDRNIPEYLGTVEQRIDDLIQMLKAAHHEAIKREDFGRSAIKIHKVGQGTGYMSVLGSHLPSVQDEADDDDDEAAGRIQPVSVAVLKDFMLKKVQRGLNKIAIESALKNAGGRGNRGDPGQSTRTGSSGNQKGGDKPDEKSPGRRTSTKPASVSFKRSPKATPGDSASTTALTASSSASATAAAAASAANNNTNTASNSSPPGKDGGEQRLPSPTARSSPMASTVNAAVALVASSSQTASALSLSPTPPGSAPRNRRSTSVLSRDVTDILKAKLTSQ